ncbi:Ribosomal RNA-processing protein 7 A [Podochytrium sp. JEL0797]|nr:Ribosomal RNA-processing protein 7 A [Podochytrium sp. JEL0797]
MSPPNTTPGEDSEKPLLETFSGFHVLPVLISGHSHSVLFKRHQAKDADSSTTVFVCNLPVDATAQHLQHLFRRCGAIEEIRMGDKGRTAHVEFGDDEGVARCAAMRQRRRVWSVGSEEEESTHVVGIAKWIAQFIAAHPPLATLQAQADAHMEQYDAMQDAHRRDLLQRREMPDEDGFTLVHHPKNIKKKVVPYEEKQEPKKKQKKLEKVDFYRFQMREAKRTQLVELRTKFEEDKKRIEKLKANRKFKPY